MDSTTPFSDQMQTAFPNESNVTVEDLSHDKVLLYIPVLIYDGLLSVFGTLGNMLVVYVFGFRFKKTSTTNYFILALAIFDLITCTIGLPFDMYDLAMPYMFDNPFLCKVFRFVPSFSTLTSCVILAIISVDRFRKICRPFKKQMCPKHAVMCCVVSSISCLVLALPILVLYGTRTKDLGINGLKGVDCQISQQMYKTKYPVMYNLVLFSCFIAIFILMATLYIFIGKQAIRHHKFRHSTPAAAPIGRPMSDIEASFDREESSVNSISTVTKLKLNKNTASAMKSKGDRKDMRATLKTTGMLFGITVAFVLSFMPHLLLMIAKYASPGLTKNFAPAGKVIYNIFFRSYFINSAINPVIYGYFNNRFRTECKRFLGKMLLCRKTGLLRYNSRYG